MVFQRLTGDLTNMYYSMNNTLTEYLPHQFLPVTKFLQSPEERILIADEPTGALDKLTTKEIIDLLKKINDFGTTVIITTHNENIVNLLGKRVITMSDGRIISDQKENGLYRLEAEEKPQKAEKPTEVKKAPIFSPKTPESTKPKSSNNREEQPKEARKKLPKIPPKTTNIPKKTIKSPKTITFKSKKPKKVID